MTQERTGIFGMQRNRRDQRKQRAKAKVGQPMIGQQPLPIRAQVTVEPLDDKKATLPLAGPPTVPRSNLPANVLPKEPLPGSTEVPEDDDVLGGAYGWRFSADNAIGIPKPDATASDEEWDEWMDANWPGWKDEVQNELIANGKATVPTSVAKLPETKAPDVKPQYQKPKVEDRVQKQHVGPTGYPTMTDDEIMAEPSLVTYLEMLGYMRSNNTPTEEEYIAKYISSLPTQVVKDKFGNRWVTIPKAGGGKPDILFSSHTDTVHREYGKQKIYLGNGRAFTETGSCLGADDTSGNWLMIEMIKAKVPGLYIFHREEEIGGNGSRWIKTERKKKLAGIKAAIAFDRKGYDSVITRQSGGRCCSDKFAKSLGDLMGGKYGKDTGGTFTDTANYTDIIGECTNLSVGYHNAHGPTEWSDVPFLAHMRDVLLTLDWSKLEFERKPGEREASYGGGGYGGGYYDHASRGPSGGTTAGRPGYGYDAKLGYAPGGYGDPDYKWQYGTKENNWKSGYVKKEQPASREERTAIIVANTKRDDISNYGMKAAREARERLELLMIYIQLYPDTVAHYLAETGVHTDDLDAFYDSYAGDEKKKWDKA